MVHREREQEVVTTYVEVGEAAAREAGRMLREKCGHVLVREKAPKDLVTEADMASQELIFEAIHRAFPTHQLLGEEDLETDSSGNDERVGRAPNEGGEFCWIVDPLDGTLNYVHQLPNYCVSIALRQGEKVICGVVYDPVLDECFVATLGTGARLNGTPIAASTCDQLDEALVAVSMPVSGDANSPDIARLTRVAVTAQSFRRQGSAALNLCYVGLGRLDAYWASSVKIWDVAAGQLIAQEAGACLTSMDGGPFDLDRPQFAVSATRQLHGQFLPLLGP